MRAEWITCRNTVKPHLLLKSCVSVWLYSSDTSVSCGKYSRCYSVLFDSESASPFGNIVKTNWKRRKMCSFTRGETSISTSCFSLAVKSFSVSPSCLIPTLLSNILCKWWNLNFDRMHVDTAQLVLMWSAVRVHLPDVTWLWYLCL